MLSLVIEEVDKNLAIKNKDVPEEIIRIVEKSIILQCLDQLWKEHIAALDLMHHTIGLRAYGQKDPLNAYKKEAFNMFSDMLDLLKEKTTTLICRVPIKQGSENDLREQEQHRQNAKMEAKHESFNNNEPVAPQNITTSQQPVIVRNIPRNSPCPCGSGKKYKHCHGKVA
jgi:preprotein translocase subunit SecA